MEVWISDPADVVEGKSAESGHSSDAGGEGQSVVGDYAGVSHHRDVLDSE